MTVNSWYRVVAHGYEDEFGQYRRIVQHALYVIHPFPRGFLLLMNDNKTATTSIRLHQPPIPVQYP